MKKMPDPNFLLDSNSVLRKVVKLKYTIEPAVAKKVNIPYHYRVP